MATAIKDSFMDLERHRQLLQDNIDKLRTTLRHWQTWEAEYEGLKEELLSAGPSPSINQLRSLAEGYEGELVNQKEVQEIVGGTSLRSVEQIINILDRRMDYVQQNVNTVEKQMEKAEHKLAVATVISTPEVRNEEGLPMTEIFEELDEEGNVISSHTSTPGSAKQQLLEVLQKAGVKDLPGAITTTEAVENPETMLEDEDTAISRPEVTKKAVGFAEDTKSEPEFEKSPAAKRLEKVMELAKSQESAPREPPVIPTDESPEDAALRREMLQYGMSEVGAVVAELDLEEGSDWSDQDYEFDEMSSDEEDAFGRSTGKVVDDELRRQMRELEERLGLRMMENVGKEPGDLDVVDEGIGRIKITNQPNPDESDVGDSESQTEKLSHAVPQSGSSMKKGVSSKKSVRFSDALDISPAPNAPAKPAAKPRVAAPISDIIERAAPAQPAVPAPQKKASRFKAARAAPATSQVLNGPLSTATTNGPALDLKPAKGSTPKPFSTSIAFAPVENTARVVPTGPEGKILAPSVVERDIPVSTSASALEPDELDPHLMHQEVATEYHKMRNRMIQRQGGFMKEDESEIVPFTEEEGGPKKMSRFKAARLAKS
ncbi:hypothetical protein BP6252_07342 [Coleophoma cylindrospora]|uniref:DUF3835 domain-containing protein n=1 Tax=Coleophoma cylindrospora TaxID=1849047 RepID=A0A3D8RHA6_9HELO|nr:hypothetical protein BP6252_07342 [Coleophoma cylindrospora]